MVAVLEMFMVKYRYIMMNKIKNKKGGFIQLIVVIIVVLFLMYYFKIDVIKVLDYVRGSFIDIANWFRNLFSGAR